MMCFFGEIWERFCKDTVLLEVVEEQFPFYVNLIFYTTTPRFAHPFFERRGMRFRLPAVGGMVVVGGRKKRIEGWHSRPSAP